jgi:hypothetical protein
VADAGSIGTYQTLSYGTAGSTWSGAAVPVYRTLSYGRPLPVWAYVQGQTELLTTPVTGTISGTVKVNGTPVPLYWVRVYYRPNGLPARSGKTDANGNFSFTDLDPGAQYFVIAFDDLNQSPDYNAQIFDLVLPL